MDFMVNLPIGVDINNLIDDLRNFSWEAADILLYYFNLMQESKNKSDFIKNFKKESPVTLADLKVHELILNRMCEKYSQIDWNYLSEENAKESLENNFINSDWLWILDPLDGTKDFIQGTNDYAMHFALNYKARPFLGLVLIPQKNELWISNGKKVWCEKRNGIKYNNKPNLTNHESLQSMTLVRSKNHSNQNLKKLIDKIKFNNVNIMGSIGCKIASIIRGDSDIYISLSLPGKSSPKDWDFAAPEAVLKAAGGAITNLNNEDLTYSQKNFEQGGIIIASNNKKNHQEICLQIRELIKEYELYPLDY